MKSVLVAGAGMLALIAATGCSSLTVVRDLHDQRFVSDAQPVAHISAKIGGVYLLYFIPLVTGSADYPDAIRFFHHERKLIEL
jgi:ABC-type enterobactin transport system permease subunit